MCKNTEKNGKTMECKCQEICCKMRSDSLEYAICALSKSQYRVDAISILEAIYSLLTTYSCLPINTCLLERIEWVKENIESYGTLCVNEKVRLDMLITELQAFFNVNNS